MIKWVDAPCNRLTAKMLIDIKKGCDSGPLIFQEIMRGGASGVGLRRLLSTVDASTRLDFERIPSSEKSYWVKGSADPFPATISGADDPANARKMDYVEALVLDTSWVPFWVPNCMAGRGGKLANGTVGADKLPFWAGHIAALNSKESSGDSQRVEAYMCPIYDLATIFENPMSSLKVGAPLQRCSILHELVSFDDPGIFDHEMPGIIGQH
jgi:hypothetical protein